VSLPSFPAPTLADAYVRRTPSFFRAPIFLYAPLFLLTPRFLNAPIFSLTPRFLDAPMFLHILLAPIFCVFYQRFDLVCANNLLAQILLGKVDHCSNDYELCVS
jgi:hypothetical protein